MKRPYAYIAGTGHAVPKQIVTNDDITAMGLETNDAWIFDRTGIRERRVGGVTSALAIESARRALESATHSAS